MYLHKKQVFFFKEQASIMNGLLSESLIFHTYDYILIVTLNSPQEAKILSDKRTFWVKCTFASAAAHLMLKK